MTDFVNFEELDNYSLITLDDGKVNAMGFDMLGQLTAALDKAEAAGKVVVIAGRPGKFSAGFDLSVMGQGGDAMMELVKAGAAMAERLLACPVPVVLAVTGHALAMGGLMLLAGDYRVGAQGNYKLGLNEVAIGMALPHFGCELARSRLTPRALEKSVNLATVFGPDAAVEAGYLDEAVAEEELMAHAIAVATQLSALDMNAHKITKARIRAPLFAALAEATERDFTNFSLTSA
jgi:enoyl-CoA hydratase/carnithine racemase